MKIFGILLLIANIAAMIHSWGAVGLIAIVDFIWLAMVMKPAPVTNKVEEDITFDSVNSSDKSIITDPSYRFLSCNIYYDDKN